jgi:glutathione S-transferase
VVHPLFAEKVIKPKLLGQSTNVMEVARIESEAVPAVFTFLDSQVRGDYLIGDRLSIADLAIISNLLNYGYLGYAIDERRYPRLAGYRAGLVRLDVIAEALVAERPVAEQLGLDLGKVA